jgi:hypothetical protein
MIVVHQFLSGAIENISSVLRNTGPIVLGGYSSRRIPLAGTMITNITNNPFNNPKSSTNPRDIVTAWSHARSAKPLPVFH